VTVRLAVPGRVPEGPRPDRWLAIHCADPEGPAGEPLTEAAARLEACFEAIAAEWMALGHDLGQAVGAELSHVPSLAANATDFGQMMAWSRLVADLAAEAAHTLVMCADPWLFRHLAGLPGVTAVSPPPPLAWPALRLALRGLLARARYAARAAAASLSLRPQRRRCHGNRPALLVYGHPSSRADGWDGYFGGLMAGLPGLVRVLHVDCAAGRARSLAGDGRTASLHAWGSPLFAATLSFSRWRVPKPQLGGRLAWLLARAEAQEAGTAQAASIAWQIHCQRRWLDRQRPPVVAWPWENHGWERVFARQARARGVASLGYQHSTVGRFEWNHSCRSNPDGAASLPDRILTTGEVSQSVLEGFGIAVDRMERGGAWRFPGRLATRGDPGAPVFVALPALLDVARQMLAACRALVPQGFRFLMREHPMTPLGFTPEPGIERCEVGLGEVPAVSAVLYAATTVGIEAILAGLPTIRFRPDGRVANDVLPPGLAIPSAGAGDLAAALRALPPPPPLRAADFFGPVDPEWWVRRLQTARPIPV
jgi:hypothetical protein